MKTSVNKDSKANKIYTDKIFLSCCVGVDYDLDLLRPYPNKVTHE